MGPGHAATGPVPPSRTVARVRVTGLGHAYPGSGPLFGDLSFEVASGELLSVVGPSGSGKSTLLHLLAGWMTPARGDIRLENVQRTQWVFQHPVGVAARSAIDHVTLPLMAAGSTRAAARPRAKDLLASFGLAGVADRRFGDLSGGEAQRLMLARALAAEPDLLLVDEPTAQLDPASSAAVTSVLTALAGAHTIAIVATHDPRLAQACDDVLEVGTSPGGPVSPASDLGAQS